MLLTVNSNTHNINLRDYIHVSWDFVKGVMPNIKWQEGTYNNSFCNVKIFKGNVDIIESCTGRCFVHKDRYEYEMAKHNTEIYSLAV